MSNRLVKGCSRTLIPSINNLCGILSWPSEFFSLIDCTAFKIFSLVMKFFSAVVNLLTPLYTLSSISIFAVNFRFSAGSDLQNNLAICQSQPQFVMFFVYFAPRSSPMTKSPTPSVNGTCVSLLPATSRQGRPGITLLSFYLWNTGLRMSFPISVLRF